MFSFHPTSYPISTQKTQITLSPRFRLTPVLVLVLLSRY